MWIIKITKSVWFTLYGSPRHLNLNIYRENIVIKKFLTFFTVFIIVWAAFSISFTVYVTVALSSSLVDFKATSFAGDCYIRQNKQQS